MTKNTIIVILCIVVLVFTFFTLLIREPSIILKPKPKPSKSILTIINTFPERGMLLGFENFRGYDVPIKTDGRGGSYRVVTDVPWKMFTIEEKFDMARSGGGWLDDKDLEEIRQKYVK